MRRSPLLLSVEAKLIFKEKFLVFQPLPLKLFMVLVIKHLQQVVQSIGCLMVNCSMKGAVM
ncbi:hypothetical protein PCC6311_1607 [Synechococcus elongatus PCC 6311]|nr:hypothetical protein M744_08810 [Synechococcus elongatus UTEX 2973]UOW71377.1 hypothetical protein PCC7943_1629 [Synechococcus elongatus PCC 7943]UOW74076.1 hypothetical protein PCC6311_1607 [Synechococcus elongatus PCC 6311]UOW76797.1 hypothetical protein PCC6301pg_1608 [Synechococcus elongatus PCC 6301]